MSNEEVELDLEGIDDLEDLPEWSISVNGYALRDLLHAIMEGPETLYSFLGECQLLEQEGEPNALGDLVDAYNNDIERANAVMDVILKGINQKTH